VKRSLLGICMAVGSLVPAVFADTTSLQSILTNVNGTTSTDFTGYDTSGFNTTTGIGTLKFTFNPGAPGSYDFDVFLDHQIGIPFFNEFGIVNGAPAAGQSYEIGDSFNSNIYNDVLGGGALPNTNTLAGTASNFNTGCVDPDCNGDLAMAMGFSFVLGTDEQELITLVVSHTPQAGFSLEGVHPVDPANDSQSFVFFTGSAVSQPVGTPPPTVPEPGSLMLLGTATVVAFGALRRRMASKQIK